MLFQQLTQKNAQNIAHRWRYKGEYARYNLHSDPSAQQEFMSQKLRKKNYFEILDDNRLFGYLQVEDKSDGYWINFGMRPELTGQGRGQTLITAIIEFIQENVGTEKPIMTAVGLVNERAIHLLRKNHFEEVKTRKFELDDGHHDYVILKRDW